MKKATLTLLSLIFGTFIGSYSTAYAFENVRADEVVVNDFPIQYVEAGKGNSLLFVHGAISDYRLWEMYMPFFSKERNVIAYTQRYHGTEPWNDNAEHYSRAQHVSDLIGFIEELELQPVDVVTHSYGGGVALQAMLKRPDLFRSGIHYEPAMSDHLEGTPGFNNAVKIFRSGFGSVAKALDSGKEGEAALRFAEAVFGMQPGGISELTDGTQTIFSDNGRTVAPFLKLENWERYDCADLDNIRIPNLIVQGGNTHTMFSMAAESISSCLHNSLMVTMLEATHSGPAREVDRFADLILGFQQIVK